MHSEFMLIVPAVIYRTDGPANPQGSRKNADAMPHGLIKQTWAGLVAKLHFKSQSDKGRTSLGAAFDHKGWN